MIAVFQKAFRDSRRMIFWLGFGSALYILFVMAFYPSMLEQGDDLNEMLESYPDEMIAMFYSGDVEDFDVANPGTYIQTQFMLWMILMMGAIVIAQGFNALTNAERDGTLDVMMSLPVTRRRYLVGRLLNTAAGLVILLGVCYGTLLLSGVIWPEFDVDAGRLALGVFGAFFPLMLVASFTYLLAAMVPSSQHWCGPVAYLFLMGSWLVYSFATALEQLEPLKPVFFFHYYDAGQVINHGVSVGDWALLAAVGAVYALLAWWRVDHKEFGV